MTPRHFLLGVVSFLVVTLASGADASDSPAEALLDKVIVTVNGDVITWSEMHEAKTLAKESGDISDDRILEELIVRRLLLQEAEQSGVRITDQDVDAAVGEIQAKYRMGDRQFQQALAAQGLSMERYRQRIGEEITISRYLHRTIRSNIVVPERDIDAALQKEGLSEDGVEEIRLRMILLSITAERGPDETLALAADIVKRIRSGESFETLAGQYSDAPSSDGSGDVGYIRRNTIRKEIADVAFSLEAGTAGDPFVVDKAVYILRVDGRRMNDDEYRQRKAALIEEMSEEVFQEKYLETLRELRSLASIEFPP